MPNYKRMYALLCGAMSDAVDEMADIPDAAVARRMLVRAMQQAEELYLDAPEPEAIDGTNLLRFDGREDEKAGTTE